MPDPADTRTINLFTLWLPAVCAVGCFAYGVWHIRHLWSVADGTALALWAVFLMGVLPSGILFGATRVRRTWWAYAGAQVEAFTELEQTRFRMHDIVEALIDPLVLIGPSGEIIECNDAAYQVFGWERGELIGQNVAVLMGEPYRSEHDGYIRSYLASGEGRAIGRVRKVLGRRKNGEDFPCEISISELGEQGGHRFVGIVRDISDREQMMAMLAQSERLAAIGELAASVAHEVNNPVNTILNCAQLLLDGDDDESLKQDILAEGERVAAIVRDLLDLARDRKEGMSTLQIPELVTRTVSLMRRRVESQGIRLNLQVAKRLPAVIAHGQQLQQVLLNLVLNSRDALVNESCPVRAEPKRIDVVVEGFADDGRDWLRIAVRDNGPGIQASYLSRVFQPFFTTKGDRGGAGLGLHVCRRIAESHGGRLTAASEFGEYTEIVLEIPAQQSGGGDDADLAD